MFSEDLEKSAFRATNGEYGWTRDQIPEVVATLATHECAILGGELWWVRDGSTSWDGLIPQRKGPDAVYSWNTNRLPAESWGDFVNRGAAEAIDAAQHLPRKDDLPAGLPGRILYNLTWVSREESDR